MDNPGTVAKLVYSFLFLFISWHFTYDPALIDVGNQQLTYNVTGPLITKHLLKI